MTITDDGRVYVSLPGQEDPAEIGIIELATFINPAGLKQIGENLFVPSAASGDASIGEGSEPCRNRT